MDNSDESKSFFKHIFNFYDESKSEISVETGQATRPESVHRDLGVDGRGSLRREDRPVASVRLEGVASAVFPTTFHIIVDG
jgi:hypothetical protein